MTTATSWFTFAPSVNTVVLNSSIQAQIVAGELCPSDSEIALDFLIKSDILGEATQTISIKVTGVAKEGTGSSFAGYIVD